MSCSRSRCFPARPIVGALVLAAMMAGCSSTSPRQHWWEFWKPKASTPVYSDTDVFAPPPEPGTGSGVSGPLGGETAGALKEIRAPGVPKGMIAALETVYFDYDSAKVLPGEPAKLDRAAEWLRANSGATVQVEGHCDERGTAEYNLSLGQRRADGIREYLVAKGVSPNQLVAISYGKERPVELGKSEEAYARNRRVQFLVYE